MTVQRLSPGAWQQVRRPVAGVHRSSVGEPPLPGPNPLTDGTRRGRTVWDPSDPGVRLYSAPTGAWPLGPPQDGKGPGGPFSLTADRPYPGSPVFWVDSRVVP
jgi:hypothetical protein